MPEIVHISFVEDLARMQPVTLEEMKSVKLMNRIDAKYLTNESTLRSVLSDAAAAGYRVLVTEGERQSPYDSVYFDTPQLKNFYDHRNKHLVRQKVRTRCYVRSQDAVIIELKQDGRAKSQMREIFLQHRIKPVRVSKYCTAVTLTDAQARPGRFKEKVRVLEKTIGNKLAII